MSIRSKIVLLILILLAIVVAAFVVYSVNTTANYKSLRVDEVKQTVSFASEEVNKSIVEMERNAVDLANAGRVLLLADRRDDAVGETVVVDNFLAFPGAIGGGVWYEPDRFVEGRRFACFYALRDAHGVHIDPNFESGVYDYFNQSWYKEISRHARENGDTVWTAPYFDDTGSHILMTTVGAGIFGKDKTLAGMATVDWAINSVIDKLTAIQPTPNSFVLLASPQDDYVISNTYNRSDPGVGTPATGIPWYPGIKRPKDAEVTISEFAHEGVRYTAFSRFMDNGWLLVVPIPQNEIFAEIERRNARFSVLVGLASLALLGIVWYFLNALVNRPLRRFIGDVEELGRGNLGVKIDVRRKDEIGRLGAAFNKMTVDLQESIDRNAREHAERERLAGELDIATKIQTSMLPCTFPAFPERSEFDIHAVMVPAREVGGDFYDFFMIDDRRLAVVIADVSGKGIPAALFMVITRTLIKNNAQNGRDPAAVFTAVNKLLCENNEAMMFVTAFMGYLDIVSGQFDYVNAGHNPPLLCPAGGEFAVLPTEPGLMLAMLDDFEYTAETVRIRHDDTLYLYTDGVTEAENRAGEYFGDDALLLSANRLRGKETAGLIAGIKKDVDAFADGNEQADDITMLALRFTPEGEKGGRP